MALYRLSVKVGSKGSGRAHFDYITGDGKYKRIGTDDDIRLTKSIGLPSWVKSNRDFWKEEEKAQDGFRKVELAIPVEIPVDQQEHLVHQFIQDNFDGYPCSYAIHDSKDGKNPHVHIMFSERRRDDERSEPDRANFFKKSRTRKDGTISGGYKKDPRIIKGVNRKEWLMALRKDWERSQNIYLERAGVEARVDCRSLADQGIDRAPQIHVGAKAWHMRERSDRYLENQQIVAVNEEVRSISLEVQGLERTLIDIEEELPILANAIENDRHALEQEQRRICDEWLVQLNQAHHTTNREAEGNCFGLSAGGAKAFVVYENGIVVAFDGNKYDMANIATYDREKEKLAIYDRCWRVKEDSSYVRALERSKWNQEEHLDKQVILDGLINIGHGYEFEREGLDLNRLDQAGRERQLDRLISHPRWVEVLKEADPHITRQNAIVERISKSEKFIREYGSNLVRELCNKHHVMIPKEIEYTYVPSRVERERREARKAKNAEQTVKRDTGMSL